MESQKHNEQSHIRFSNGICTLCETNPVVPGYAICSACLEANRNPEIPGLTQHGDREFRYVSDGGTDAFLGGGGLFEKLTCMKLPRGPKNGGVITENCKMYLPTGERLHGISYRGDMEGYRHLIEEGAKTLGLLTAKIEKPTVIVSDNRIYPMSECRFEFYNDEDLKQMRKRGPRKKPKQVS